MVKNSEQTNTKKDREQAEIQNESSDSRKAKTPQVRKYIQGSVFALIVIGLVTGIGSGSICSIGYDSIAALCPLGALESLFGSGTFFARTIIILVVAGVVIFFVGKAFCSWICPIPPLDHFLSSHKRRNRDKIERSQAARQVSDQLSSSKVCSECTAESFCKKPTDNNKQKALTQQANKGIASNEVSHKKPRFAKMDGRHVVLGGSLLSAAIFGFPVFCLICPVGLTFATAIALYRFIGFNEPTLDIIIFPLIIVAELVFLRKWCHRFCPIGALMSLVANFNKTTRPKVNPSKCLRSNGSSCTLCSAICPELIDPVDDLGKRAMVECTRCGKCIQTCPTNALRFTKKGSHYGK